MTVGLVLAYSSPAEARYLAEGVMAYTEQYTPWQLIQFDVFIDRTWGMLLEEGFVEVAAQIMKRLGYR